MEVDIPNTVFEDKRKWENKNKRLLGQKRSFERLIAAASKTYQQTNIKYTQTHTQTIYTFVV